MSATATADAAGGQNGSRARKWVRVSAIIIALLLLGFGLALLVNSQAIVGSVHQRNARALEIIAGGIESWPKAAGEIARSRALAKGAVIPIDHPDFGQTKIKWRACGTRAAEADRDRFVAEVRPDQGTQYIVAGIAPAGGREPAICFDAEAPLSRIVGLDRAAAQFTNVLLVAADGTVIEQIGASRLPITSLPLFRPVSDFARSVSDNLIAAVNGDKGNTLVKATALLDSGPGAAQVEIANTSYYLYARPFRIKDDAGRLCPGPPPKPGDRASPSADCPLYAIGLMPSSTLRTAWLAPPPVVLTSFGLAFLIALALVPLIRLVLIGSAESASPYELFAIVFGTIAAAAIAALTFLYATDTVAERTRADKEGSRLADSLAFGTAIEIGTVLGKMQACLRNPASRSLTFDTSGPLPTVGEATFYDADGKPKRNPKAKLRIANVCGSRDVPLQSDISSRPYFQRLGESSTFRYTPKPVTFAEPSDPRTESNAGAIATAAAKQAGTETLSYAVGEVRAQTDGLKKTIIVARQTSSGKDANTLLATTYLKTLFKPVLPPAQGFLVVDTFDDKMPVLFHSEPGHALQESFADRIPAPRQVLRALRQAPEARNGVRTQSFSRRYDGHIASFSAAPVSGTDWVVLVFHRRDDIDRTAANAAVRALLGWGAMAILSMIIGCLILLIWRGAWRCLWPSSDKTEIYRRHLPGIVFASLVSIFIAWAAPAIASAAAIILGIAVAIVSYIALRRGGCHSGRLDLRTERSFRHYALAMLACGAIVPMIAMWSDSREVSRHIMEAARADGAAASVTERAQAADRLRSAIDSKPEDAREKLGAIADPLQGWGGPNRGGIADERLPWSLSRELRQIQMGFAEVHLHRCTFEKPIDWYCWKTANNHSVGERIGVATLERAWPGVFASFWLLVLAIALTAVIFIAVQAGLGALTGFGIPLNAVTWPTLVLIGEPHRVRNELKLARKTMLIAPQQAVRQAISKPGEAFVIDLAAELLPVADGLLEPEKPKKFAEVPPRWIDPPAGAPRLVVSGLELVLRDPKRRRAALTYLERAVDAVEGHSAQSLQEIILIVEMSPLERILDAFEVQEEGAAARDTLREELRWARLFQDFTTFAFAPIDKVDSKLLDEEQADALPPGERLSGPARTLAEELRWLPGNVIDGIIADTSSRAGLASTDGRYPLSEDMYQAHYTDKIIDWARSVDPVTDIAAIDFLRANLIEHYEQCWAASSLAERFVLDAISRGAFVNMRKAIALQSLVRRGLVILDPAPKLMSRSFGLFIAQTERPNGLAQLRKQHPKSAWAGIRMPLAIGIPVIILGLAVAAAESGQELTALISLLAAGAPALIGTVMRSARGTA